MRRFKSSSNSPTIGVSLYDGIDFVCPFDNNTTHIGSSSSTDLQYYVIYMVYVRIDVSNIRLVIIMFFA